LFFLDLSDQNIYDEEYLFLEAQPNVLITSHQAFLTKEALINRADTTFKNINAFDKKLPELCLCKT
jgi:D-lactate dehydrogenase